MAGRITNDDKIRCSFCGKSQQQVRKLIAGPNGAYICDECVDICSEIIDEELMDAPNADAKQEAFDINLLTPQEMKSFLDDYVIGQDEAKKVLSVAVYNHYKRITSGKDIDVELQKSNVLMLGPTGSGKTLLAQTLARVLGVPFAIADATTLTEAGYVGEDVENILLKLIQAADYDIQAAEMGIIYIDEIDKITKKSENVSITRMYLVKCTAGFAENYWKELWQMLIISNRLDSKSIGFQADIKERNQDDLSELLKQVLPQDFIKFGLIPEFIGRVPINVSLEELDENAMVRVLTEPKNSLVKQYQALFSMDDVDLEFDRDALVEIAKKSIERKTGARGLRAIMENVMMDYMYNVPSDKSIKIVQVTKDMVDENLLLDDKKEQVTAIEGEQEKSA